MKQRFFVPIMLIGLYTALPAQNAQQWLNEANQLMSAGNLDSAIVRLDQILEVEADHAGAWIALGKAYRAKQEYDQSLSAFLKAYKFQPVTANLLNVGLSYALLEQKDTAFEWLQKLKETKQYNMNILQVHPATANLKDDTRFAGLLPSIAEYANPFVEKVKIIHEWKGEAARDQFGWIARNLGDLDKDGVNDVVISAPTNSEGASTSGKIYVYSGKSGKLLWQAVGTQTKGQLGNGVEAAGDVNGDGCPDVIAGAPYVNSVFVYSGLDGKLIHEITGNDKRGAFGNDLRGVGDVDGDGFGDVLIGEPYQIFNAPINAQTVIEAGKAHLYSGKDGSLLFSWQGEKINDAFGSAVAGKTIGGQSYLMVGAPNAGPNGSGRVYVFKGLNEAPAFVIEADETGSRLGGMFLSIVGDVNGDQVPDMYASDWSNSALGNGTGRIYVHSGLDGQRLLTLTGEHAGDGFGIGVADAGDVNEDGNDDLIIGAWQFGGAAPSGGKVYIFSGKNGTLINSITGKVMGETFGFDATGLGDVDGDGSIDFLLTSAWSSINGFQSGRVYVISGSLE